MNILLSIQIYIVIYNYLVLSGTAGRDLLADCPSNCIGAQPARSWLALLDDYPTLRPCSHDIIIIFVRKKRCIWIAVSLLLPTSAPDSRIMWTLNILDTILVDLVQLQIKLMKHDNCYNNDSQFTHITRCNSQSYQNEKVFNLDDCDWLWLQYCWQFTLIACYDLNYNIMIMMLCELSLFNISPYFTTKFVKCNYDKKIAAGNPHVSRFCIDTFSLHLFLLSHCIQQILWQRRDC